jgi:hypothetical protein
MSLRGGTTWQSLRVSLLVMRLPRCARNDMILIYYSSTEAQLGAFSNPATNYPPQKISPRTSFEMTIGINKNFRSHYFRYHKCAAACKHQVVICGIGLGC